MTLLPVPWQPWPTGLRVQHIRDALGDGAGLLDQLTAVVNLLAQGRACASVMPVLAGAGLVACPSPLVGSDPLPLGSFSAALRECLMQAVRAEARVYFWPVQAGVAVPGGAEAAVHCLRAWVGRRAASHDSVVVSRVARGPGQVPSPGPLGHLVLPAGQQLAVWGHSAAVQQRGATGRPAWAPAVRCGDPALGRRAAGQCGGPLHVLPGRWGACRFS